MCRNSHATKRREFIGAWPRVHQVLAVLLSMCPQSMKLMPWLVWQKKCENLHSGMDRWISPFLDPPLIPLAGDKKCIWKGLVGLDLFNDYTCPSGHISRPTQVNVSQSFFHSLNKLLKSDHIAQFSGLVENNKLHHIREKNPASRRNSTMQVSKDPTINVTFPGAGELTHCGLVMPYGDIHLGQHWLR